MNKLYLLILFGILTSAPAQAQDEVQPVIYNRIILKLIPKPEAKVITMPSPLPDPKPLPMTQEKKPEEKGKLHTKAEESKEEELRVDNRIVAPPTEETPAAPPPRVPIDFTVEMKSPEFLTQTDFITHTDFGDHEGLLISIDPAGPSTVRSTQMVSTSDVIFIDEDGAIIKIAPNLNLATLNEPIPSGGKVRGVLYLKPGSVEQDRIVPGDKFEGSMFKTHPIIMQ